jgi:hypothetical protein
MADNQRERESAFDDFAVEITDLDRPDGPAHLRGPRLTPRQRRWSLALTAALSVLLVSVLLVGVPEVRTLVTHSLFPPQSTVGANTMSVYLRGNPSWGRFTLDGKALAPASNPVARDAKPLVLTPGTHRITWQVEPFRSQTCVFTVVNASTLQSPCLFNNSVTTTYVSAFSARFISFFASLNGLPPDQRAFLAAQIREAFTAYENREQVRTGETYAVSESQIEANPTLCTLVTRFALCYARATEPLQATLEVQMDTSTSASDPCIVSEACLFNHQDCRMLCEDPMLANPGQVMEEEGWNVSTVIHLSWSYSTLSGRVVGRDLPDSALRGSNAYQMVSLHLDRNGQGWFVVPFPMTGQGLNDPFCNQAAEESMQLANASGSSDLYPQQMIEESGNVAAGCLVILATPTLAVNATPTPTPASRAPAAAYCLVRFGVVLAANDYAHQLWPYLPRVDAYEQHLVQNLLALT